MKATFSGKVEGNHTSFVRIKIGKTPAQKDVLILPFDVEITSGLLNIISSPTANLWKSFESLKMSCFSCGPGIYLST